MRRAQIRWRSAVGALLVGLAVGPVGAELSAQQVLERVLAVQERVEDYTARCTLTAQIPGVDLPQRTFQVYYKRPGKLKIESQELVLVPREALTLGDLRRHLTQDVEAVMAGVGSIGDYPLYCLKLKPRREEDPSRVLVWVRGDWWLPTTTELWLGQTRQVRIDWTFGWLGEGRWLPTRILCTIPSEMVGGEGPGYLTLTWENYKVNTGLSDEIFASGGQ